MAIFALFLYVITNVYRSKKINNGTRTDQLHNRTRTDQLQLQGILSSGVCGQRNQLGKQGDNRGEGHGRHRQAAAERAGGAHASA